MLSRAVLRSSTTLLRNASKFAPVAVRSQSTILDQKEHHEETRYIRKQEELRKEEMRKNIERILAMEETEKEKQRLVGLLEGKKEEEKGFIQKWGLDDWRYSVPIGMLVGIPFVANEVLILDAELQLTACFILFVSSLYLNAGPMIAQSIDSDIAEPEKEMHTLNMSMYTAIENAQRTNNGALQLEEDLKLLHQITDQVSVAHAQVLNQVEEQKYREAVVKKLETLAALEETAASAMRSRIVSTVKSDVEKTLKTNKTVQENALNNAISILSGGANAKIGKDVVGEVFVNALKQYKDTYAKQPEGQDPILKQLEKDAAALAAAPEVATKGGNVFVVHPVV